MTSYNLPENYTDNSEGLLRKNRSRTASSSATLLGIELVTSVPSATTDMAKSFRNYSTLVIANVPIGPIFNTGTKNFELRTGFLELFYGLPSEDACAHDHVLLDS